MEEELVITKNNLGEALNAALETGGSDVVDIIE